MLIDFTLRNWCSFGEEASFSMVPSKERRFGWTLSTFGNDPKKLLPIAVFYGANASGKTNLLKGLHFVANFVIKGCEEGEEIPVRPYQLDPDKQSAPTYFSILFRTKEQVYQYEISLTKKEIIEEKLIKFISKDELVLFYRNKEEIKIHKSVEDQRAQFVFEGTQNNCPFITSAFKQKISFVSDPYEWFRNSLVFVDVNKQIEYEKIYENNSLFQRELSNYLAKYDTGINGLLSKEEDLSRLELVDRIIFNPKYNTNSFDSSNRLHIIREGDKIKAIELYAIHKNTSGEDIYFDFRKESHGTNRLIDLLQAIIQPKINNEHKNKKEYIYIIDEIDRSLHPNILCQFITDYLLQSSADSRVQFIVTTHNTALMDQNILRRDEIWIIDKNNKGTTIFSVNDFKTPNMKSLRFDKILDKLYREGRLGGVPKIVTPSLPVNKKLED